MMTIPKRYEDLTVEQFMQLEQLKEKKMPLLDKAVAKLSILSGLSIDEVEAMNIQKVYDILLDAIYLNAPISSMPLKDSVLLGYKKFKPITVITDFTTAQHKDFNEFLKQNNNNYVACLPNIIAICHKELTMYGYKYKPDNHFKNVEIFKKAKLKDVMGAVFFYSNCFKNYSEIITTCLENSASQLREFLKEVENDKQFQDSLNSGGGITQSVNV
jgi:hypothetical protein